MNCLLLILTILVLVCLPCSVLSQGIWKYYTRANGLAGDSVTCIIQDKSNNYWFGTWGAGFSKLDTNGIWTNFLNSSDSTVTIIDFKVDSLNNIWMILDQWGIYYKGTYVVKYDGLTFYYYDPMGDPKHTPNPCTLGQDASGHIWCGASDGGMAYMFNGENWLGGYIPGAGTIHRGTISEIVTDRHGRLYFAHDCGISTLTQWIRYFYWTHDIAFDHLNHLWFGCYDPAWNLGMFDGENWHTYPTLGHWDATRIAVDSSNNVWAVFIDCAAKFDGSNFTFFNSENGLAQDRVMEIYVDRKGDIWFAHWGGGVSVLHDTTTALVKRKNIPINETLSFDLSQNFPNPFNQQTMIQYELTDKNMIELSIYNLEGEEVSKLVNELKYPGFHQVIWDGTDNQKKEVSSGIYFAVLKSGNNKQHIKLTLIH